MNNFYIKGRKKIKNKSFAKAVVEAIAFCNMIAIMNTALTSWQSFLCVAMLL